jgi:hypothetical protein
MFTFIAVRQKFAEELAKLMRRAGIYHRLRRTAKMLLVKAINTTEKIFSLNKVIRTTRASRIIFK